jgi:hypothetical protein
VQFSTQPCVSSVEVVKLVDSNEDSILAKFQPPMSCSIYGAGVQKLKKKKKKGHFSVMLGPLKITV